MQIVVLILKCFSVKQSVLKHMHCILCRVSIWLVPIQKVLIMELVPPISEKYLISRIRSKIPTKNVKVQFKACETHTWYLSIFLHRHICWQKIFYTQKRVNRDKKISIKQRKSPKKWFYNSLMRQNTINCTHNFSILQILSSGELFPHDNMSCGKLLHMKKCDVKNSPHDKKFSTGTACGACDKYQVWWDLNLFCFSLYSKDFWLIIACHITL